MRRALLALLALVTAPAAADERAQFEAGHFPLPSAFDLIVDYDLGLPPETGISVHVLGVNTATDKWKGNMGLGACGYIHRTHPVVPATTGSCVQWAPLGNTYSGKTNEWIGNPFPVNQWAAVQEAVPGLESVNTYGPAVRVNADTDSGYFWTIGWSESLDYDAVMRVWKRVNGEDTWLAWFGLVFRNGSQWFGPTSGIYDAGYMTIEAWGADPVHLRVGYSPNKTALGGTPPNLTTWPTEIPISAGPTNTGMQAWVSLWEGADSAPNRIRTGAPGIMAIDVWPNASTNGTGDFYEVANFNAGPLLTLSPSAVVAGSSTLTVWRPVGTTVSLSAPGATVGSISWTDDVGTAALSGITVPVTVTATASDGSTASTTVTATTGIPVKDRAGATVTVRDRSGTAVAVKGRN